jgi:hypothetical protein
LNSDFSVQVQRGKEGAADNWSAALGGGVVAGPGGETELNFLPSSHDGAARRKKVTFRFIVSSLVAFCLSHMI